MTPAEALALLMDQVDYKRGKCRVNDLVGAVLPPEVRDFVPATLKAATSRSKHLLWCRRQPCVRKWIEAIR